MCREALIMWPSLYAQALVFVETQERKELAS